MVLKFWKTIIFALFFCLPHGICQNFRGGKDVFACRAVLRSNPRLRQDIQMKPDMRCIVMENIGESGLTAEEIRCEFTTLNSTRNYVHLMTGNCKIGRLIYSGGEVKCVLHKNGQEKSGKPFEAAIRKFKKFRKSSHVKHIVYFINSTELIRNGILNLKRVNAFNTTKTAKRRAKMGARYLQVFICSRSNGSIERKKRNGQFRNRDEVFHKTLERERRRVLGNFNNSTAFPSYFPSISITYGHLSATPALTRHSRSLSESRELCPPSVVVNRSTILVTPTAGTAQHKASLVARSKLTQVTQITSTSVFRNNASLSNTRRSTPILSASNATSSSRSFAHLKQSTNNATFIYNKTLVSVVHTAQDYAFISTLSCATVAQLLTTSATQRSQVLTTPTCTARNTPEQNAKNTNLYLGLIIAGGIILAILFCIALFLFIRRYRRIQALRRKAKQISYFNRFDCSSAWDEPDRFGGSKLSVFTLKNSKFDIDWDSSHDTKQ